MSDPGSKKNITTAAEGAAAGTGALYAISVVWVIVAAVFVVTRIFTRFYIVKSPGADDATAVLALVASVALSITMIEQIKFGMNTETPQADKLNQAFWASVWTYNLTLALTKVSILFSYFRIFIQRPLRIACWILLAFVSVFGTWTVIGSIFVCVPVSKSWTTTDLFGSKYCQNRFLAWFVNAAINMVLDLALILLPMPMLRKLNMPLRQRVALMFVFALGSFVCVMSTIRLYFLVAMSYEQNNRNTALWSVIEVNVGIICACLPPLKALLTYIWPRFSGYTRQSQPRTTGAGPDAAAVAFGASLGLKPAGHNNSRHMTSVTAGLDPSAQLWNEKEKTGGKKGREIGLRTMLSTSSGESGSPPASGNGEVGIAVTTILEQEIETMGDGDSRDSSSISEGSSQQDLVWRKDSAGSLDKKYGVKEDDVV